MNILGLYSKTQLHHWEQFDRFTSCFQWDQSSLESKASDAHFSGKTPLRALPMPYELELFFSPVGGEPCVSSRDYWLLSWCFWIVLSAAEGGFLVSRQWPSAEDVWGPLFRPLPHSSALFFLAPLGGVIHFGLYRLSAPPPQLGEKSQASPEISPSYPAARDILLAGNGGNYRAYPVCFHL